MSFYNEARLAFEVSASHYAQQVSVDEDRTALGALGQCCVEYLRLATGQRLAVLQAAPAFLRMLRPSRVPVERSYVPGVFRKDGSRREAKDSLQGVLYFLHPPDGSPPWYLTLLLLEPTARGQGLGTAVHEAFVRWAAARGARRTVVAVAENNPRALHFWQERIGYGSVPHSPLSPRPEGGNRDFELHLTPVRADSVEQEAWKERD